MAEMERKRIEERMSSGLPLGGDEFVKGLERDSGHVFVARKSGWPKGRRRNEPAEG